MKSGVTFQHERRRLSPMAGEFELIQWLSLPGRQVALLQGVRQFGRVSFVSDGHGRPRLQMLWYLVNLARPVGEDADHLMDRKTSRRCLHQQIPGGQTQVVYDAKRVVLGKS